MPVAHDRDAELRRLRWRARAVPIASTIAGSALAVLPVIAPLPLLPPFGFLLLLGWRLLRPELWPAWIGLPLGLTDDLLSGRPLGTAAVLWTAVLLGVEAGEDRMIWRTRLEEWALTCGGCAVVVLGSLAAAQVTGGGGRLELVLPQLAATILLAPLAQRLCAALDDRRLAR